MEPQRDSKILLYHSISSPREIDEATPQLQPILLNSHLETSNKVISTKLSTCVQVGNCQCVVQVLWLIVDNLTFRENITNKRAANFRIIQFIKYMDVLGLSVVPL